MSAISPPWPPSSTTLKWGLESNTGTFTSPLTKKTQMIARQGSRWHCTNELAYLNEDNARDWEGFFWLAQDGGYSFYWNRYPFNIQAKAYPNGISDSDQVTCDSDEITCDDTSTTCDAAYSSESLSWMATGRAERRSKPAAGSLAPRSHAVISSPSKTAPIANCIPWTHRRLRTAKAAWRCL
jgi:hypothetical protein